MTQHPIFFYYISNDEQAVNSRDPLWNQSLPLNRYLTDLSRSPQPHASYGDYFTGIRSFLSRDNYNPVFSAVKKSCRTALSDKTIRVIRVYLMKHGEYYHPARIKVDMGNRFFLFVLNVAVSSAGLSIIKNEIESLNRLARTFPYAYMPRVFARGEVRLDDRRCLKMFLGDWFEGFKEFHLSPNPQTHRMRIIVWDDEKGPYYLDESKIENLYTQTAQILTGYYNVSTFEQISYWHHAAGDFIVNDSDRALSARLVSVRGYRPLFENAENDTETMLDALLVFFLNLSIRMRLDRIDGIGDFEWADERAVAGTVRGFFHGLHVQSLHGLIPPELVDAFKTYLSTFKPGDLLDWATAVTDRSHPHAPEAALIRANIRDHAESLYNQILQIR